VWRSIQQHYNELRVSVFVHCPIGAIDSTYELLNISKTRNLIFAIFSGFFAVIDSRSHTKNWGNPLVKIWGRGWEEKSLPPHFLPHGGSGGSKIFSASGSPRALLKFRTWRPSGENCCQGAWLTIKKNFYGCISGRAVPGCMHILQLCSLVRFIQNEGI